MPHRSQQHAATSPRRALLAKADVLEALAAKAAVVLLLERGRARQIVTVMSTMSTSCLRAIAPARRLETARRRCDEKLNECSVHALLSKFFLCYTSRENCYTEIVSSRAIDWYLVYLLAPTDSQITRYPLVRWGPLTRGRAGAIMVHAYVSGRDSVIYTERPGRAVSNAPN